MKQIKFQEGTPIAALQIPDTAFIKAATAYPRALYFTTPESLFVRLSYEGKLGWRMQVNTSGYESFDLIGAAQSLSVFMEEEVTDRSEAISIRQTEDALILTAPDHSSAVLSLDSTLALKLLAPGGNVTVELTSLASVEQRLVLQGKLAQGEAIYGGGERLDRINKRGTKMDLYTFDGWNNSSTSYTVIPLFWTTRGGGMFFNRYEIATIDFGTQQADTWCYKLRNTTLDCYLYATKQVSDVLQSYTSLAGHAHMPQPWMQGVHICRQAPDFLKFDTDRTFKRLEDTEEFDLLYAEVGDQYLFYHDLSDEQKADAKRFFIKNENATRRYVVKDGIKYEILYVKNDAGLYCTRGNHGNPLGNSVKTIIENFIHADMKPDVASMEPRGWERCFVDSDESRENKADLIKSVKWLHDHGMRSMLYIAVGFVYSGCIGFKDEYMVHADVTIQNPDGTTEVLKDTTRIPWIMGTAENPDIARTPDGSLHTLYYLDITNEEAVDWYFNTLWSELIDIGIDGLKIDFCEMLPDNGIPYGSVTTQYHWKNPDKLVVGAEHHAYPTYFISAFYKRMQELQKQKGLSDGFMVFSRGGGIGSQRSPYMWAGDQCRDFEKLDDQIMAVVTSGLSGVPFMSYDMGGYQYIRGFHYHNFGIHKESEIFIRGTQFTAFTTNMQTHGDVRHAYDMSTEVQDIYRFYTRLHNDLIPYMQKCSAIACKTGMPPVRHPVLHYTNDANLYDIVDEFMLGDALLVAPIIKEQTFERSVYLPKGKWQDLLSGEIHEGGKTVTVQANLAQIPVFLNLNSSDATELEPIFGGINWSCIKNWK